MAKKDFKGGLESLLQSTSLKESKEEIKQTEGQVLKSAETRATFIVREDYLEKIKAIAYWDRLLVKDVINLAFGQYLEKYGNVKSIPEKQLT